MSRASNTLKASDISTTPIKLKYSSSYLSENLFLNGIQGNIGANTPFSQNVNLDQRIINYRGIRQLYYQNYLTSSLLNSASYFDPNQQSTACSGSYEYENRYFPTESNSQIYTISIPPILFGEQISRNSLIISPKDQSSYRIIDDGNGNLIDTVNNNTQIGNVIYSQGLLIITNQNYTSSFGISQTYIPTNVIIGTQIWSPTNLDITTYRNGDIIPQVTDPTEWANLTTGAWCYYNNDSANGAVYGKLYNWYAVNDPRGLAPYGWHIPTYNELQILTSFTGGNAGKLKATTLWNSPNTGATNQYGFAALPGGNRDGSGAFNFIGQYVNFWTSTVTIAGSTSKDFYLSYNDTNYYISDDSIKNGFYVRLIKD